MVTPAARAVARRHAESAELAARRRIHPGIAHWRWLASDEAGTGHAFDEAAGIPWRSACGGARWTVRRTELRSLCAKCKRAIGGGAAES